MNYSSTISSKGQVTVPQEIRHRLGLAAGDRVEFVIEGERTVIRPARTGPNPFEKYRGILGTFPGGQKEINAWISDLRDDDARRQDLRDEDLRESEKDLRDDDARSRRRRK
ncbi:MAG TPA: AbrB/MazE/SpoVT family DNA-binding domain-containing protein [Candidatus Sulfotelmatobacter sp.]|jgi:AbrB family looped-hinge helix DNA binding protein